MEKELEYEWHPISEKVYGICPGGLVIMDLHTCAVPATRVYLVHRKRLLGFFIAKGNTSRCDVY